MTAAVDLLPNKSHATANVTLLARLQKLSTASLTRAQPMYWFADIIG